MPRKTAKNSPRRFFFWSICQLFRDRWKTYIPLSYILFYLFGMWYSVGRCGIKWVFSLVFTRGFGVGKPLNTLCTFYESIYPPCFKSITISSRCRRISKHRSPRMIFTGRFMTSLFPHSQIHVQHQHTIPFLAHTLPFF